MRMPLRKSFVQPEATYVAEAGQFCFSFLFRELLLLSVCMFLCFLFVLSLLYVFALTYSLCLFHRSVCFTFLQRMFVFRGVYS